MLLARHVVELQPVIVYHVRPYQIANLAQSEVNAIVLQDFFRAVVKFVLLAISHVRHVREEVPIQIVHLAQVPQLLLEFQVLDYVFAKMGISIITFKFVKLVTTAVLPARMQIQKTNARVALVF